jgi:hypothetical protein
MREQVCLALAKFKDQPITLEVAQAIVRDLFPDNFIDLAQFATRSYGKYTFRAERFHQILPELHRLHELHYRETEHAAQGLPLQADYESRLESERAGRLLQFTARAEDGELVGSMRVYIKRSSHTGALYCEEDVFFVVREHRGSFMAIRLWQYVEDSMRQLGVHKVTFDSKTLNKADRMAAYLNYTPVSIKHEKILQPQATTAS